MTIRLTLPTHYHTEPHARARAFAHVQSKRRHKPPAHKFDFPTEQVGATADVTLYYDPQLGNPGADLAQQIKPTVEQTYVNCRNYFGIDGKAVNVIIAPVNNQTDGTGGAYHYGCSFNPGGDLYIDAAFGNPLMTTGLIVAELTESFMGAQNKGWDCGGSNGEALSRFLAELEIRRPERGTRRLCHGPGLGPRRPTELDRRDQVNGSGRPQYRLRRRLSLLDDVEGPHRGTNHPGRLPRRQPRLQLHRADRRNQCVVGLRRGGCRPRGWGYVG